MGYSIDYATMQDLLIDTKRATNDWKEEAQAIKSAQGVISQMGDDFTGFSAENVKKYYVEAHGTMFRMLYELISIYQSRFALYNYGYQNIDPDPKAVLPEEAFIKTKAAASSLQASLRSSGENLSRICSEVGDLVCVIFPSAHARAVDGVLMTQTKTNQLQAATEDYESAHATDLAEFREMLTSFESLIKQWMSQGPKSVEGYTAGQVNNYPQIETYREAYTVLKTALDANQAQVNEAFAQVEKLQRGKQMAGYRIARVGV